MLILSWRLSLCSSDPLRARVGFTIDLAWTSSIFYIFARFNHSNTEMWRRTIDQKQSLAGSVTPGRGLSEWHLWTPLLCDPLVIYHLISRILQYQSRIQILVGTPRSLPTASLSFPPPFHLDLQKPLRHFMESPMFRLRLSGLRVSWCLYC